MHYFLSRRADRLEIGTLNLLPVSSNAVRFGAVPIDGNQIMSCFVITRLQVNPPVLNNRLASVMLSEAGSQQKSPVWSDFAQDPAYCGPSA